MSPARRGVPTKRDLVVLAVEDSGGASRVVHTEDVAVAAHKLAPKSFSWRRHPDQIDLDSVRVSLTDARKEKYGSLVSGSIRDGWRLTEAGVEWAETLGSTLRSAVEEGDRQGARPRSTRSEGRHLDQERTRLMSSDAFVAWAQGLGVRPRDAAAVFRIDAYTPRSTWQRKIDRVSRLVADDARLNQFIENMRTLVPTAFPTN